MGATKYPVGAAITEGTNANIGWQLGSLKDLTW